jgi:phenylacetyl-CoA:acceptor oxidoreductase
MGVRQTRMDESKSKFFTATKEQPFQEPSLFWSPMGAGQPEPGEKWVPAYCLLCNAGPDPIRVHINKEGVADRVEGNPNFMGMHPNDGKCCFKAMSLIEKLYNPHRIKGPMKRTNPKKGASEDPGWKEISWDEALNIVASKLKEIRKKGMRDETGQLRVAVSTASDGVGPALNGTWIPFFAALGPVDGSLRQGSGVKCAHCEHVYGELWHASFVCFDDTPFVKLVINFGRGINTSTGTQGYRRYADARSRGARFVQVEPHLSVSGAKSDEWIPIKPKTDAAFMFAMIHSILYEIRKLDIPFLKQRTNAPYLIRLDNGYYLEDSETHKPLVWDSVAKEAKPFDGSVQDFALEGEYEVDGIQTKPSFQLFTEAMEKYTPEWAVEICDVAASTIRRLATEWVETAQIGNTIEIDGEVLPYRPVCINLGKDVNNGLGAYQAEWASHMLSVLVGGFEVPGGHMSPGARLLEAVERAPETGPRIPGPYGFAERAFAPTDKERWHWPPSLRTGVNSLNPLSSWMGAYHLAWKVILDPPEGWPKASVPEVYITHRANPALSQFNLETVRKVLERIPFYVAFAYTFDETSHYADILLPEATDLEGLQLFRMGGPNFVKRGNEPYQGFHIRQPVATPVNTMDITDIFTELAARIGILEAYNKGINRAMLMDPRTKKPGPYSLELGKKYRVEEIVDAQCKTVTGGKHGLEWFKENGGYFTPYPRLETYHYREMVKNGLRYELPYQGRLKRIGDELKERLREHHLNFWDKQMEEYKGIPDCYDFSKDFETGAEYDMWLICSRAGQFAWATNAMLPMTSEVSEHVMGLPQVQMNTDRAAEKGLRNGDKVLVTSPWGEIEAELFCRQGIRPDCLVVTQFFGHWMTPLAKDKPWPNMNEIEPNDVWMTDATGSSSDHVKVRISKKR